MHENKDNRFIPGTINLRYSTYSENDRKEEDMKTTKVLGVMIGAWLVLGLGLGTPFSLAGETTEVAQAASGQQHKEEYQKKIETQLKELNQELKEWKDKAKKMEEKARSEMDEQLSKLSKKEEEASKKFEELRLKSGKAWEDLKAGVDSAMEDLGKAFDQMRSRFKSS
jgi:TolA-binding protein